MDGSRATLKRGGLIPAACWLQKLPILSPSRVVVAERARLALFCFVRQIRFETPSFQRPIEQYKAEFKHKIGLKVDGCWHQLNMN